MTLKTTIEKAVEAVCKRISEDKDLSFQDYMDALKLLTPFYTSLSKKLAVDEGEIEDGVTFEGFANGIANAKAKETVNGSADPEIPGSGRHS